MNILNNGEILFVFKTVHSFCNINVRSPYIEHLIEFCLLFGKCIMKHRQQKRIVGKSLSSTG